MQSKKVSELMVPIAEYATIHEDATMEEAMQALENENRNFGDAPYRHQSLVVMNDNKHVVGRVSQIDMLRSLEPGYSQISDKDRWLGRSVLSKKVLITLREEFGLWEQPLESMCTSIQQTTVKDYMQKPTEGEFVFNTDTLNIAAHRTVMGRHHSLLVIRKDKTIVGILRATDLFNAFYDMLDAGTHP